MVLRRAGGAAQTYLEKLSRAQELPLGLGLHTGNSFPSCCCASAGAGLGLKIEEGYFFFPFSLFNVSIRTKQPKKENYPEGHQSLSAITVLYRGLVHSEQSTPTKTFKVALILPKRCCLQRRFAAGPAKQGGAGTRVFSLQPSPSNRIWYCCCLAPIRNKKPKDMSAIQKKKKRLCRVSGKRAGYKEVQV